MNVTYRQIIQFRNVARQYLSDKERKRSKLHYALERMVKETLKHNQDYADEETKISIDLASVDKENNLIVKDGNFVYTKDNAKKRNDQIRELLNKEVEVEPFICSEIPELESNYWESFVPFVLEERKEEPVKIETNNL